MPLLHCVSLPLCRSPTEALWPAGKHQERCKCFLAAMLGAALLQASMHRRPAACPSQLLPAALLLMLAVASRLQNALSTALLNNSALRDSLVQRLGFAVKVSGR